MVTNKIVKIYKKEDGYEPLISWMGSLDVAIRARIKTRLDRLASSGNFGDWSFIREGLFEMRFDFGAGYRVYYAMPQDPLVILLWGGIKKTQKKDIVVAIGYLRDFRKRHTLK